MTRFTLTVSRPGTSTRHLDLRARSSTDAIAAACAAERAWGRDPESCAITARSRHPVRRRRSVTVIGPRFGEGPGDAAGVREPRRPGPDPLSGRVARRPRG